LHHYTIKMMNNNTIDYDLTVWSEDDSFFVSNDPSPSQKQNVSPYLSTVEAWDINGMDAFWESLESDFGNDPHFKTEVMYNKVNSQPKVTAISEPNNLDALYLNASTFLSPVSIAPSSPENHSDDQIGEQKFDDTDLVFNLNDGEDLENTSAMDYLNTILASSTSLASDEDIDNTMSTINTMSLYSEEENVNTQSTIELNDYIVENKMPKKVNNKRKSRSSDSDDPIWEPKAKVANNRRGTKRSTLPTEVKKERKKDQNKTAANRYRLKKRAEQQEIEVFQDHEKNINDDLRQSLEKLQMELKVVLPLAQMAFANDPKRMLQLQMLQIRCLKHNLLD